MPLTEEQQKRLDELKARRRELIGAESSIKTDPNQILKRTPEQEQRLKQLIQRRDEISESNNQERTNELLDILNGRLPSMEPEKLPPFAGGPGPLSKVGILTKQQEAFTELQNMGMSPEQIKMSSQARKLLRRSRIGRDIGGMGGAIGATMVAGRVIPGPIDDAVMLTTLIATGGAGFGGLTGEAIQTGIEEKRILSKREALKAFVIEAGIELGGRGIVLGGKLIASPFIKKTVPEAAALVDDFAKVGGQFSPSELDKRFSLRIAEAFSRGSFGAKEIFQEFEEKQGRAVLAFADNIIESIGEGIARETPEAIGEAFARGITKPNGRVFNLLDDLFNPLFKQLDDVAAKSQFGFRQIKKGGPIVVRGRRGQFQVARELQKIHKAPRISAEPLKKFARKQLAIDKRLNGQFLSPVGRTKFNKVMGMSEDLTFSDWRKLRSSYLKDVRKLARDADTSEGLIKQLAGLTDDAVFDPKVGSQLSEEAKRLWLNTRNLYKASQKGLETTFSETLAKRILKNPSRVVKEIFPADNSKSIRLLRKSLLEPISGKPSAEGKLLWNQLRQSWLADAVNEATKEGVAKPKVFNNIIRKLGKGFDEMFPEKSIANNVKKIQTIFETAGRTPPTGASLFSRGAQVVGMAKMYDSGKEGDFIGFTQGAFLTIGPLAFAKLATHPQGIKLLTAGFKMKPGASGLVPNMVRMVRILKGINIKEIKTKQRAMKLKQRRINLEKQLKIESGMPTRPVGGHHF